MYYRFLNLFKREKRKYDNPMVRLAGASIIKVAHCLHYVKKLCTDGEIWKNVMDIFENDDSPSKYLQLLSIQPK